MGKAISGIFRMLPLALMLVLNPALIAVAQAEGMTFQLVTLGGGHCGRKCPQVISAQGEIGEDSPDEFVRFVRANVGSGELHGIVLLDSPGGRVAASMELGQTIRSLGMAVIVARPGGQSAETGDLYSGKCYSACVYALMGGRKRVIPPQSRVGVHRMFNYTTSFDLSQGGFVRERYVDDGDMRQKLARYSAMMGVSTGLINLAEHTSPDRIHVLTRAEISRWRLGSQRL
jgi:hypothetical protein